MKITFLGATQTVTGSKYLLESKGKKILLDCGLFQGLKNLRLKNREPFPVKASAIDAIVLTHAHIDHSGYIPLLVKNGFKGPVYTTEATKALCQILLPDAGHLQEEDALYANKHKFSKHAKPLPLYTEKDAINSLDAFKGCAWEKSFNLSPHLSFSFHPVGHILGAAFVKFYKDGKSIVFSGDIGRLKNLIMPPPASPLKADYLVVESTYGNRLHPRDDPKESLKNYINQTLARGGTILIPAFAVGRAQELLYLISKLKKEKKIKNVPVYLNSPMAVKATKVFYDFIGEHALTREECRLMEKDTHYISTVEESKALNLSHKPCIIISASGMATGGRVLHHLKSLAPDPKNLILLAGFQAAGTRGEALARGVEAIKIHGEMVPVKAHVAVMETLSAHADADEIMCWLKSFAHAPKNTFITHGEPMASDALRQRIEQELKWTCRVPLYGENYTLKS